ncbi:MAG: hypothetical protein ABFS34_01220 [Gemmatimonadota bacterium]
MNDPAAVSLARDRPGRLAAALVAYGLLVIVLRALPLGGAREEGMAWPLLHLMLLVPIAGGVVRGSRWAKVAALAVLALDVVALVPLVAALLAGSARATVGLVGAGAVAAVTIEAVLALLLILAFAAWSPTRRAAGGRAEDRSS